MSICMEFEYGFVWNYEYLYVNYVCMELVKFRMEKCRFCTIVWICLVLVYKV